MTSPALATSQNALQEKKTGYPRFLHQNPGKTGILGQIGIPRAFFPRFDGRTCRVVRVEKPALLSAPTESVWIIVVTARAPTRRRGDAAVPTLLATTGMTAAANKARHTRPRNPHSISVNHASTGARGRDLDQASAQRPRFFSGPPLVNPPIGDSRCHRYSTVPFSGFVDSRASSKPCRLPDTLDMRCSCGESKKSKVVCRRMLPSRTATIEMRKLSEASGAFHSAHGLCKLVGQWTAVIEDKRSPSNF